jgi:predicted RNA-binding protein with PUA-like domain
MARSYWLVKSEPNKYSWDDLVKDGSTYWDGVRNYMARNNLAAMKKGDLLLYYHSNEGKDVVGVAQVTKESYPDPTIDDERWVVVDLAPVAPFEQSVTLAQIKADPKLDGIALVKYSRLSVAPITPPEFRHILELGKTKLPASVAGAGGSRKKTRSTGSKTAKAAKAAKAKGS